MTNIYKVKSPTRVDLAGGTLDLWPLYNFFGGAKTVNLAIDIFTTAEIEVLSHDTSITFESIDLNKKKFYLSYEKAIQDQDSDFALFRIVTDFFKPQFGFKIKTSSESPVGGGLGGSSSLLISMLRVFSLATMQNKFKSIAQLVEVAHNLEAQLLITPTGTQDYYPAASGGINILEYSPTGIKQNVFDHGNLKEIEDRMLLVYTGRSHHSGMNNFEVLQKSVNRDPQTIKALSTLRIVAEEMSGKIRAGHWHDLGELFRREYDSRIQLAPAIMSPEIEKLHKISLESGGAEALKICGAGGGGCVLVWCFPGQKEKLSQICHEAGFQPLKVKPHPSLVNL